MIDAIIQFLTGAAFYAYLVVFVIGLGWILVGLILGGLENMIEVAHDVADAFGGDADSWGHQQVGLSPFSPLMLAVFGMLFGVTGMTLEAFTQWHVLVILLITLAASVLLDAGLYRVLYSFFVRSQSSSLPSTGDAVGTLATVATRIAPGMTGTINYEAAGRRQVSGARTGDGATLDVGEVVRIESIQGGIARVRKKEE